MRSADCLRYIDSDGTIYDYPDGVDAADISELGYFCSYAYMEPHWGGFLP